MISSTESCGCLKPSTFADSCSPAADECDNDDNSEDCLCDDCDDEEKPIEVSEIAKKCKPYREIETLINDNKVVLRIQRERAFDPLCDCLDPPTKQLSTTTSQDCGRGHDVSYQKVEGCRTIEVYPQPDAKRDKNAPKARRNSNGENGQAEWPTVNPEENPNIFVLKIKRRGHDGDKKHNLELEFKTPRPWSSTNK